MDLTPKYGFQLPSLDDLFWNEPTNENWELTELLISGTEALASGTQGALASHIIDVNDAHPATAISYDNASSSLTAENAQDALDELKDITDQLNLDLGSYLPLSGGTMSGNILFPSGGLADGTNTVGFNLNGFTNSFAVDARTHAVSLHSAPLSALLLSVGSYRGSGATPYFMSANSVAEARLSASSFIIRASSNTPVADTAVSFTNWLQVDTNGLELQALKRIRIGTNDDYVMGWDGSGNRMLVRGLNGVLIQYRNAGVATNLVGFGSTAANFLTPITFSGDTNIYRNAANELKTDDSFVVGDTLIAPTSTGFNTKSTSNTDMGFWYPLGTFSITAASGRVHGQLSLTRNGGNTGDININAFCLLNFSVKQTTMNTPPDVTLTVPFAEGSYYDQDNLALVVTQNDAIATVATLYVKSESSFERHTYSFSNVRKLGTATFTVAAHESTGGNALPSGTVLVPTFSIFVDPLDGTVNAPAFVGDGTGLSGVEKTADKNQVNGYAGLDSNGKILNSLLPIISGTVYSVNGVNPDGLGNIELLPSDIGAAEDSHNHDGSYSPLVHNHDGAYASLGHNHDSLYAAKSLEDDVAVISGTVAGHVSSIAQLESDVSNLESSKQDALGYTPENQANRGVAGGYAPLGFDGKVPVSHLPAIAINDTFVVSGTAEMIALTAERGDVAVRTDENKSYILKTDDPSLASNWQELLTPTDTVTTVNGQSGNVVLTTSDISEGSNLYFTNSRVQAVGDARYLQLTGGSVGFVFVGDLNGTISDSGLSTKVSQKALSLEGYNGVRLKHNAYFDGSTNRFMSGTNGVAWRGDLISSGLTLQYSTNTPTTDGTITYSTAFNLTSSSLTLGGNLIVQGTSISSFSGQIESTRSSTGSYGFSAKVTGDTSARYAVRADGKIEWGTGTATRDTFLYRQAAGVIGIDGYIQSNRTNATSWTFATKLTSETLWRFAIEADGKHRWSDGTNSADTFLYRNAAGTLKTDGAFEASSFIGDGASLINVNAATLDGIDSTGFALSTHNHDGVYATASHNHNGVYADASHNHDAVYRKKTDTAYVEMFAVADLASLSSGEIMDYRIISGGAKNIGKVVISSLTTPGSGGIEIDIKIKTTPAATATSIFTTTPVLTGNGGINWMTVTTNFDTSTIPDDAIVILEIVSADGGSDLRVEIYE